MDKQIKVSDGDATLSFEYSPEGLGPDVFALTMSDGGGFSSLYIDVPAWNEFKRNVDQFIANTEALK